MPPPTSSRRDLIQIGETLTIGAAGGIGFSLIGLPAGLVSGSMLAVAAAALVGRPMKVPMPLARICFIMIGMLLGAVVTPETLKGIATWPASVAILRGVGRLHHRRDRVLSAFRAWMGCAFGAAWSEPRLDGAGHGAVGGVRGRRARHRGRASHARAFDCIGSALRPGALWAGHGPGGAYGPSGRQLRSWNSRSW